MPESKETFVRLYIENQATIYSFILTLVYDVDVASDLLQETAVFMWERFDSFQPGSRFADWGVSIARYKVLEYFREKKRCHPLLSPEQLEHICEFTQKNIQKADRTNVLQHCLKQLNDNDRSLLLRRYRDGMSVKNIAISLGRPVQGLYKTMGRIFYTLQRCVRISMRSVESGL